MLYRSGRTCWKRFATVLLPAVAAAAALGIGMAQGALAASFFISDQKFQLAADRLAGRGVSIYPVVDVTRSGTLVPVVVLGFNHADVKRLCVSAVIPIPVLGPYTLMLTSSDQQTVEASNLFIDTTSVRADQVNSRDIDLGVAAGAIRKGPINPGDRNSRFFDPNVFASQVNAAVLTNVRVISVASTAGTLSVPGFYLQIEQGSHQCF
ncbi:DUF6230 family protein [Streptomyces sp. NPDC002573]|uniref:DUF6230 family protein n=1 Tax=Streptomyces sp. NPDC002573 TaxID=3364651 RepID=UPI0036CE599C